MIRTWLQKVGAANGQPIDTSLFSLLITFDHMGKIGFSHEFKTIEAGKENRMLHLLEVTFGQVASLGELSWPLAMLKDMGVGGEAAEFDQLTRKMADTREKVTSNKKEPMKRSTKRTRRAYLFLVRFANRRML